MLPNLGINTNTTNLRDGTQTAAVLRDVLGTLQLSVSALETVLALLHAIPRPSAVLAAEAAETWGLTHTKFCADEHTVCKHAAYVTLYELAWAFTMGKRHVVQIIEMSALANDGNQAGARNV
jgi:hypothetical protein